MNLSKYTVFLAAWMLLASAGFCESATDRFQVVTDRLVKAINEKDYPGIRQDFDQIMLDAFPLDEVEKFFGNIANQCGRITKLDPPRMTSAVEAVFPAHYERTVLDIKIVLNNKDKIIGLWLLPHTADIPVPEKNVTPLQLPFKGAWTVVWGGDTKELNQHHDTPNQKYAFDFLITKNGKTHQNEGLKNEDYFAFGQEVFAPADGVVTDVIKGVRDNTPGSMNPYSALGNTVIIKHREHEISILAHLMKGSICVNEGDTVKQGQRLGLCGNSGNSSEPHLHYHLQNTEIVQDGTGIPCFFEKVRVIEDGTETIKKRHSPIKDEIIEQL